MNNTFMCKPCNKFFSGIIPYRSHVASEKHKKNFHLTDISHERQTSVNQPTSIVQDFRKCNFNSSDWKEEPFIISFGNGYKCSLCKTFLNSVDQVISHINGAKHLKAKTSSGFTNFDVLSDSRHIPQVDGNSSSSALAGDPFQLYMHMNEFKELVDNMEVFKPNDEIIFSTI